MMRRWWRCWWRWWWWWWRWRWCRLWRKESAAEGTGWQGNVFCRRQNLGRSSNPEPLEMMTMLMPMFLIVQPYLPKEHLTNQKKGRQKNNRPKTKQLRKIYFDDGCNLSCSLGGNVDFIGFRLNLPGLTHHIRFGEKHNYCHVKASLSAGCCC